MDVETISLDSRLFGRSSPNATVISSERTLARMEEQINPVSQAHWKT